MTPVDSSADGRRSTPPQQTSEVVPVGTPLDERLPPPAARPSDHAEGDVRLFPTEEAGLLRQQWMEVMAGFEQDPRRAVEQAESLVANVVEGLARHFGDERARLERRWERGDEVATEELRGVLQRYRLLFQKLLTG